VVFASSDRDEAAFQSYFGEMPWLALPYSDRELKETLSKKFKVSGIPTLVVLDKDGNTVTTDGRSEVSADPEGVNFPWTPPSFAESMPARLVRNDGTEVEYASLEGKTVGIYFSAHWCPPCKGFTPELVKTYEKLKAEGKPFEVIFASSDRDEAAFQEYFGEMPWLALPYSDRGAKEKLSKFFGVQGIPSFHIVEHDGTVINNNGRGAVGGDPEGLEFPWRPKPVNDLSAGPDGINETPSIVVLMENVSAEQQAEARAALDAVASRVLAEAKAAKAEAPFCFYTGKAAGGVTDRVRQLCQAGEAGEVPQLILLDIPDNGGYYKTGDVANVTEDVLNTLIEGYRNKSLTRHQLG